MGMFDNALPGGDLAKPLMVAVGALLLGKMTGAFGGSEPSPQAAPGQAPSAGGLGGLLDRLTSLGHGDVARSWVSTGPNQPIQPQQLGSAIGQTTLSDLARQTGMSEQDLLNHLAETLPRVVDRATPNGQVPSQAELQSMFARR